jgi:CRISPR/Cas system-associated endoribonuclease Cas2
MTYDIRDPKRWRKVYELMKGHGERLQLSVFRCLLTDRDREKLRWELSKVMDKDDTLLVLGLWGLCRAGEGHQPQGGLAGGVGAVSYTLRQSSTCRWRRGSAAGNRQKRNEIRNLTAL